MKVIGNVRAPARVNRAVIPRAVRFTACGAAVTACGGAVTAAVTACGGGGSRGRRVRHAVTARGNRVTTLGCRTAAVRMLPKPTEG